MSFICQATVMTQDRHNVSGLVDHIDGANRADAQFNLIEPERFEVGAAGS
jgi:hypothetical protein